MTIAVTQFVAAAAKALPGTSAPTGAEGLPAVEGFADILLGQVPPLLQAAAPLIDDSGREPPILEAPTDAAQLFAALGLPYPGATGTLPADDGATMEKTSDGVTLSLPISTKITDAARDAGSTAQLLGIDVTEQNSAVARAAAAVAETAEQHVASKLPLTVVENVEHSVPAGLAPEKLGTTEQIVAAKVAGTGLPQAPLAGSQETTSPSLSVLTAQFASATHTPPAHAPSGVSTAMQLATPVRDAAWPAEFAQKVTWMARQDLQSAQITLNPPQLGPIEISLDVRNDQASAVFVSASAEVREAIESAVPRLREMLAGVGVELGQTNVSHQSFRNGNGETRTGSGNAARDGASENSGGNRELAAAGFVRSSGSGRGLVDTFA